jgi:hypothetical protein
MPRQRLPRAVDGRMHPREARPNDPITLPNLRGAAHRHDFFDNAGVNAHSTYDSLKGVTSTCAQAARCSC